MVATPITREHAEKVVDELMDTLEEAGKSGYLGEPVSQKEHSLQCAYLAEKAREAGEEVDDDTILAALLHDIGRFTKQAMEESKMYDEEGTFVGTASHEILGERYLLRLGFSEKLASLVGAHVVAKRYLTAVDKEYYDGLSQSSKTTLKYQGGPFTPEQVEEAQKDPHLAQKLAVRKWDDLAKEPNMETPPLSHYREMALNALLRVNA